MTTAERFVAISGEAEFGVNHVEKIGGDHGDFVDDEGVESTEDVCLFVIEVLDFAVVETILKIGFELKKRVYGETADVDGGNASRGDDGYMFLGMGDEIG